MSSNLVLVVESIYAEKIRKMLMRLHVLDLERKALSINGNVYFPIIRDLSEYELNEVKKVTSNISIDNYELPKRKKRFKSLIDEFKGKIPDELLKFLPRSFEFVGDILIIEIPDEILNYKYEIGKKLLNAFQNVKVVLMKLGSVSGTFRIRKYEVIAGENRTYTIHREHGCYFYVDLSKAYFSPRLSEEHRRIMELVSDNDVVVDLFTGIGPFAILIAKNHQAKIYAIDLNPSAIDLLRKSITINKLRGQIIPIVGDAREVVNKQLRNVADHVIMNLPGHALEFIDVACTALKEHGVLHLYAFVSEPKPEEKLIQQVGLLVESYGRKIEKVLQVRRVRESAPHEYHMVIDAQIM